MSPRSVFAALTLVTLGATACTKDIALAQNSDGGCPVTGCGTTATSIRVPQSPQNKVDILFMVANSARMAAVQEELKAKFSAFLTVFNDLATAGVYADLHIGVVTSDYGAGDQDNTASGCGKSPGGDLGKLQAIGKQADASCVPPTGVPFIEYAFQPDGTAVGNIPAGNTPANLVTTFTCMASGIDTAGANPGCGFEHQLESVYAALHNTTDNGGFLRSDALLAIVFVTGQDDGSAAPSAHIYESGSAADATYGPYNVYRKTHWAVSCDNAQAPYSAMADLTNCEGTPNTMNNDGLAYDITRYTNYFTQASVNGGVKADPNDVILVAIDAPVSPFSTILAEVGSGGGVAPNPAYVSCPALNPGTCDVHLQHSCQNSVAPAFAGDPPVRLDAVVSTAKYHQSFNICGDDLAATPDYSSALQNIATIIAANIGQGCIPAPVADATNPNCVVDQVTPVPGSATQQTAIPNCATNAGARPCWVSQKKLGCAAGVVGGSPQGIGITVEFDSADGGVPSGSYLDVTCATL
jgi:hypothetical protein